MMLVLAALFLLRSGAAAGAATTYTDCANCHTTVSFAVQALPRNAECYTCHLGASHASWDDGSGGKTTAVFVAQRGYFKTVDSYNSSPGVLHTAHAGTNRYANSSGCSKCHQTAACTTCHNNVSHNQHSLTGKPSVPGYTAPAFLQADGITDPPKTVTMSCALSQCHQKMPGVVRTNPDGSALCANCHTGGGHNHNVGANGYDASPQANCGSCHATNPDKTTAELATIHQQASNAGKIANYSCNTCHNPTFVGSVIGDGALDMMRSGKPIYCADCHDGTKAHAVNHQPDHQSTGNENVTCNVCHDGITVKGSFNAPAGTAVDVSAAAIHSDCNKCHATINTTVQNFINANKGQLNPVYQCSVCHDTIAPRHNKLHTANSYLNNSTDTSCSSCHNLDVTVVHSGILGGKTLDCNTCHSANPALPDTKTVISANLSSLKNPDGTLKRTGYTCQSCHGVAGHNHPVTTYDSASTVNCKKCHATDKTNLTTELSAVHAGAGLGCETCHNAKFEGGTNPIITRNGVIDTIPQCKACHNGSLAHPVHANLALPHLSGIFPTATDADCLKCHETQKTEFASTQAAYHSVNGLASKAAATWGNYLSPWTATSNVGCKGCHGDNKDGKAQVAKILKRPYTYTSNSGQADMLCFLCHNRTTYGYGSDTSGKTGFSSGGKNYHNIGDHKVNNVVQCTWCHGAVPHGTAKAHLIVTKSDPLPYSRGNVLTGFTHPASGQYQVSSCTSDVSMCDEH